MKSSRLMFSCALLGVTLVVASCGDHAPTGPASAPAPAPAPALPQATWVTDIFKVLTSSLVDSCASLSTEPVSQTIGRAGGTIAIGPDTLRIPPRALTEPVTITASLPVGYFINVVVFKPDGLTFKKPASLTMGYSSCSLLPNMGLEVAEVADDLNIIQYLRSTDNKSARTVTGAVLHFTNYAVAY
ncbi:MAG TPA: hypothetical protein VGU74_14505 [Gemmatimonadales bacterium]|nr:hypothetical protein [Gemmatimonadales bacterium]